MTQQSDSRKAWDWSRPITRSDGAVHARETCECKSCVKDREIRDRVRHNSLIDDLCWLAGSGRWAQ